MKLQELIKEVEMFKEQQDEGMITHNKLGILQGIKQTVEAVDVFVKANILEHCLNEHKEWKKLKELLGIK